MMFPLLEIAAMSTLARPTPCLAKLPLLAFKPIRIDRSHHKFTTAWQDLKGLHHWVHSAYLEGSSWGHPMASLSE